MKLSWFEKLLKPRQEPGGKKTWLIRGGVLLIWVICLGLIFGGGWKSRDTIIPYLLSANYFRFIGVFFFYLGSMVAPVIGWSVIMRNLDGSLGWWRHIQIYCITFAARRLPGTLWYVGGRMGMYQQLGVAKKTVLAASSIEMIALLVTGGLVGLVFMLALGTSLPTRLVLVIIAGVILGTLILQPSALKAILKRLGNNLVVNLRFHNVLVWFLLYTIAWIMGGLMISQLVSAFQPVSTRDITLIIEIWALSGTAGLLTFLLPSSFGVTELTLTFLLSQIMPLPLAGVIAILNRLMTTFFEILLSAAFYPVLTHLHLNKRVEQPPEEEES